MLTIRAKDALQKCKLFADCEPPEWLCGEAERVEYRRGEVIYSPEVFRRALAVVAEGAAEVESASGVALNRLGAGGLFGVAAAFGEPDRYVSTVRAATSCTVLFISGEQLARLFREHPDCAVRYAEFLTDRIRFLNAKIDSFTSPNVVQALEKWLLRASGGEKSFVVKSWSAVARTLGISRTSLYRALESLSADGKLVHEGKKVTILEEIIND